MRCSFGSVIILPSGAKADANFRRPGAAVSLNSRERLILGLVEMSSNKGVHISRTSDASQVGIKDELRYARSGLNFDLQDVRLGREQHTELQLLGSHLVGHGMGGLNEHFVGRTLRIGGVNGHADSGKDVQI